MKQNRARIRKEAVGLDYLTAYKIRVDILGGEFYSEVLSKYLPKLDEYDALRRLREATTDKVFLELMTKFVMPQRLALQIANTTAYVREEGQAIDCICVLMDAMAELREKFL